MTIGARLAKLAERDWASVLVRTAMRLCLQFRPYALHIDVPPNAVIETSIGVVQGFMLLPPKTSHVELRLAGVALTWVQVERNDAKRLYGKHVRGFRAITNLDGLALSSPGASEALLQVVVDGVTVASKPLQLPATDVTCAENSARKCEAKREWLKKYLVCPSCRSGENKLHFTDDTISCRACGSSFPQDGKALNFLPEELKEKFRIADWDDISAHEYDCFAKEVIEEARRNGGKVLDCGSGLRKHVDEAVICLEVDAFPNVDVLGVNQRLPFRDAVFDAVLSLSVLEHVTDPFSCAAELARVLKPGGMLYCTIPFLQPEHGYPDHYFNATRSGMRQLFDGKLDFVRQFVPSSGEPIWSLHWFLEWYARELPPSEKDEFLNLRVRDILANSALRSLQKGWVNRLSDDGKWCLAANTAALLRKPELTA